MSSSQAGADLVYRLPRSSMTLTTTLPACSALPRELPLFQADLPTTYRRTQRKGRSCRACSWFVPEPTENTRATGFLRPDREPFFPCNATMVFPGAFVHAPSPGGGQQVFG
jgi:hypothetical protein